MSNVLASLIVKIGADIKDYSDGMKQSVAVLGDVSRKFESLGATMTAAVTLPIVGLGAAALQVAGKFEQTQIAFTQFLGSAQAAKGYLADLYNFAATTPFQIADVTRGAQSLMAMGFAAKDVIPSLRILGDQLSAVGRPENMQNLILAFGQMKAKGTASMEELRQMMESGVIPAVKYLAEGLGKTETEIFAMVEKKAIDSGTAIKIITAGMARDTGGMMQGQAASLFGQFSNFKDKITLALKDIGDTLLPLAKSLIDLASRAVESVKNLAHAFAELPVPVQQFAIGMVAVAAAIGPVLLTFGFMANGLRSIMSLWPVLTVMTGATITAAGAMLGFAGAALVSAIAAIGQFSLAIMTGASPSLFRLAATAIPEAIAALSALATAIYTRVLLAFTVLQTGGVAALSRSLYAMVTASVAASSALATFSLAASSVLTGLIAYNIGKWAYENLAAIKALGDGFADFLLWFPDTAKKLLGVKAASSDLQAQVDRAALSLKNHNIVIQQGSMNLVEYAAKLHAALRGLDENTSAMDRAVAAARDLKLINKQNTEDLDGAVKVLANVRAAYKLHAASATDVAAAVEVVRLAMAKVHPEYHAASSAAEKLAAALSEAQKHLSLVTEANKLGLASSRDVRVATDAVTAAFQAANPQFEKHWTAADKSAFAMKRLGQIMSDLHPLINPLDTLFQQMAKNEEMLKDATEGLNTAISVTTSLGDPLGEMVERATLDIHALSDAFSVLGVTSSATLRKQAADTLAAYKIINSTTAASNHDRLAAWVAMEKARQAAAIAADQAISASERKTLQKAEADLGQHTKKMKGDWQGMLGSIRQSIESNLSRTLSDVIFRVGSLGESFKKLGQDIVSLILNGIVKMGIEALINGLLRAGKAVSTLNMATVKSDAAAAASGAFKSVVGIPIIGPILAPAAAAAAFAGVMAFESLASFDKGGFIPEDMIAQVHKGEYVLTAAQVDSMSRGGGAPMALAGGNVTIHVNGDRNPRETARLLMRHLKTLSPKFSPAS